VRHGENEVRLQALHRATPPAADSVSCELGRETCSERETGTGKLCEIQCCGSEIIFPDPTLTLILDPDSNSNPACL
jgi:hypothetical protein